MIGEPSISGSYGRVREHWQELIALGVEKNQALKTALRLVFEVYLPDERLLPQEEATTPYDGSAVLLGAYLAALKSVIDLQFGKTDEKESATDTETAPDERLKSWGSGQVPKGPLITVAIKENPGFNPEALRCELHNLFARWFPSERGLNCVTGAEVHPDGEWRGEVDFRFGYN